jgi:hypothetical protein
VTAPKKSKYEQIWSGEWIDYDGTFDLSCCHCHLVHKVSVRVKDGKIQMRLSENARATAAMRRHHALNIK